MNERQFLPLNIAVLTVSDTRVEENDSSGQTLVQRVNEAGHRLAEKRIVRDNIYRIRAVVSQWIADPTVQVVISTGGTGVTGRDGTPEAVKVLFDKTLEGFGETFRKARTTRRAAQMATAPPPATSSTMCRSGSRHDTVASMNNSRPFSSTNAIGRTALICQ